MATIQKLNNTTLSASGLTKLYKDPLVNDGTIVMYDFLRTGTWNGENPSSSNTVVGDLSLNENDGTVVNPAAGATFSDGFYFGAGNTYITLPSLTLTSKSLLITLWYKWTEAQVASTVGIFGNLNNSINDGQFAFYAGTTHGTTLKARVFSDLGSLTGMNETLRASQIVGDIVQASFIVDIGSGETTFREVYYDDSIGINIKDTVTVASANGLNASIDDLAIGAMNASGDRLNFRGKVYRVSIEDLDVSGNDALLQIKADWNQNRTRFS